ncbi:T9SS type A sorting domain-containing protein [candidate division KSB1 bacterium]|nr:T9SS type A sorting domain-containing protein [candidate division KSB1 bacterium]
MQFFEKKILLFCSVGFIFIYALNLSAKWRPVNTGLSGDAIYVNTITVFSDTLVIGTNGGVFKSFPDEIYWNSFNQGLAALEILTSLNNGTTLFIGTGTYEGGVFRWDSETESWNRVIMGMSNMAWYVNALALCENSIFAATEDGIWTMPIYGSCWQNASSGIPRGMGGGLGISAISLAGHNNVMYAGVLGAGIFKSSDNGENWTGINTGLDGYALDVRTITFVDNDIYIGTDGAGILKSTDGGQGWAQCNSGLTNLFIRAFAVNGTTLYAGTDGNGVFKSTNGGDNWGEINAGFTFPVNVYSLVIHDENIYAATFGKGVFVNSLNALRVEQAQPGMARRFELQQNYPNPFNASTEISYTVSIAGPITLNVYDIAGKLVRVLINQIHSPGNYKIVWDGTDRFGRLLASGLYLYRLDSHSGTLTKQMLYLK